MNILIKFPSRGRPDKFKDTFNTYVNLASNLHNIQFVCSFDEDDILMNNIDIKNFLNNHKFPIHYYYGNSSNKIEAINADMNKIDYEYDILILAADDLYPVQENYDDIIVQDMLENHPDMDGCLHYMNPNWEEKLDIGCIMTKKYFDRFNYIYHPSYKTIYCDNEYMDVAKLLGKHRYVPKQIFMHNYVVSDPTADRNWIYNNEDEKNYNHRKQNHFYLDNI